MNRQKRLFGFSVIIGSIMMGLLFFSATHLQNVVYAGTTEKAVPEDCFGPNGEVPAEYSGTGGHIAGTSFGTVSVTESGAVIEVDYTPNPPFTVPIVACLETTQVNEVIKWKPASRPDTPTEGISGVIIDTSISAYPVNKSSVQSDSVNRATQTVTTVWMVWGEAPYSIFVPIVAD